ncbi:hypothetical protein Q3H58_004410 [Pseudomonas psychrotolerans]|nr:hypothetical protein [Pseudomonas psychrotolerans]
MAYHVHGRHQLADELGHGGFQGGRGAVGEAVLQLAAHGIEHVRVAVAEDHRTPGADVVDVAPVVFIDDIGTLGMLEEQRGAADALEGAHRRVDAAGDVALGLVEELGGTGHRSLLE